MLKNSSKIISSVAFAALSSSLYAGGMGPVSESQGHALFADGEAAYTWNSVGNTIVRNNIISPTNNGWGGRVGAGAIHYFSDKIGFTGELGWGYYGQSKFSNNTYGFNSKSQIYGMDLLVGTNYHYNDNFDLFLKLGGMLENVRVNNVNNVQNLVQASGASVNGISNTTSTYGSVVPEIKVGGIYDFSDQWGVSVAYMYVFGNENVSLNTNSSITDSSSGLSLNNNLSTTTAPVALSTIMFGLHYKFA
jgi:hypothetical protein